MDRSNAFYVSANRAAWDASADYHRASETFRELKNGFSKPGFSCLDKVLTAALKNVGVEGRTVGQLCCNNGREILSIRNMAAASCTGFDQSPAFLAQARELAEAGTIECDFVETDIYGIPTAYDGRFDVLVITIGVFGWMPELDGFFRVAARLLKPDGDLVIYEKHPIMNMFEPSASDPFKPLNSYFRDTPFAETGGIVYDATKGLEGSDWYWFVHPLSAVITACLDNGLQIVSFREYPHNISSDEWAIYDHHSAQLPQSYMLTARLSK